MDPVGPIAPVHTNLCPGPSLHRPLNMTLWMANRSRPWRHDHVNDYGISRVQSFELFRRYIYVQHSLVQTNFGIGGSEAVDLKKSKGECYIHI
jgi:hypothetical protein